MEIKRILYVEDNTSKYMDIVSYFKRMGYSDIEWADNSEKAFAAIRKAKEEGRAFDLYLFDMHFEYDHKDDRDAGEKLMHDVRAAGDETPIIFVSSDNWKVPGAIGNIWYLPQRDWEEEAEDLMAKLKRM